MNSVAVTLGYFVTFKVKRDLGFPLILLFINCDRLTDRVRAWHSPKLLQFAIKNSFEK